MSRLRLITVLTVVSALALAGVATAKVTKVSGGNTIITLSTAATSVMTANHLTATPIAPAKASGSTFTFPILGGRLNQQLHGFVTDRGGFAFSNGTRTIPLRHLTAYSSKAGVSLWALVAKSKQPARIARVTGVKVTGHTATGTVHLTRVSANVINKLAGRTIVKSGVAIGGAEISATVG